MIGVEIASLPTEQAITQDLTQHVEDDIKVHVIRNCVWVELWWNEQTPDERRAAYCRMFQIE